MDRVRPYLTRAACVAALVGIYLIAQAGSLEPPAGPAAPTMKTLSEVEPGTPIHQSDLPLTIVADGHYYLAENLYANQNFVDMITVIADNASIDLHGFTINGTSQVAVANECIELAQNVRTFGLTNGVVRGCGLYGVWAPNSVNLTVTVDRVQANQNGHGGMVFTSGSFGVISRSVANNNGDRGILLTEGVITDCAAFGNGGTGLMVVYGTINGCTARSNANNAIVSSGGLKVNTYAP